jgi:thymidylate kinase
MVLIIEGIDGIGKSTITQLLAEKLAAPQFNFSPFPAQNELSEETRWKWMDYVHLQTCKLYSCMPEKTNLICDRGTASNPTLRLLKEYGKDILKFKDEDLFELMSCLLESKECQNLLEAENFLRQSDSLTLLLKPLLDVEWVRKRNLARPNEPPYSTDYELLKAFDKLYFAWQVVTKAPNKTIWVSPSDKPEDVFERITNVISTSF